jgi:hypothetical protein
MPYGSKRRNTREKMNGEATKTKLHGISGDGTVWVLPSLPNLFSRQGAKLAKVDLSTKPGNYGGAKCMHFAPP